MDDMPGSTIERARKWLAKQGLDPAATIIQEIRSHMSEDRLRRAIEEDRETAVGATDARSATAIGVAATLSLDERRIVLISEVDRPIAHN